MKLASPSPYRRLLAALILFPLYLAFGEDGRLEAFAQRILFPSQP